MILPVLMLLLGTAQAQATPLESRGRFIHVSKIGFDCLVRNIQTVSRTRGDPLFIDLRHCPPRVSARMHSFPRWSYRENPGFDAVIVLTRAQVACIRANRGRNRIERIRRAGRPASLPSHIGRVRAMSPRADRIRYALECAAYFAVIVGLPLLLLQQCDARQTRRVETAMQLVTVENDPAYVEARVALAAPFGGNDFLGFRESRPSEAGAAQARVALTQNIPRQTIVKIADFYSSVVGCRNRGLCDDATIDQFFKNNIRGFYCSYQERLAELRASLGRDDYGNDLRDYAGSCG